MNDCFIGLGSNLGDRLGQLSSALDALAAEPGFFLRRHSSAWETEPVGPPQPRYLNAVVQLGTLLSPRATLQRLFSIEERLGRVRRERWAARTIDLDLLLLGDRRLHDGALTLPHPELHLRSFVLAPLCEIAPQAWHPVLEKTAAELLALRPATERAGVRVHRALRRSLDEARSAEPEPAEPSR